MSNYRGHCAFNILLALPVCIAAQFYILHPQSAFLLTFAGTFIYTTLFMSPDLDLVHNIKLPSVRGILSLPFRAYSSVFKHRGISHSFFWGSLTRIGWLSGVALLIFFILYETLPSTSSLVFYWKYYRSFLL